MVKYRMITIQFAPRSIDDYLHALAVTGIFVDASAVLQQLRDEYHICGKGLPKRSISYIWKSPKNIGMKGFVTAKQVLLEMQKNAFQACSFPMVCEYVLRKKLIIGVANEIMKFILPSGMIIEVNRVSSNRAMVFYGEDVILPAETHFIFSIHL